MSLPPNQGEPASSGNVPRIALTAMFVIVAGIALVSLFSNVQRIRREKIETVTVRPAASPSPSAP